MFVLGALLMILQAKRITGLQGLIDNVCRLCLHWCYSAWIPSIWLFVIFLNLLLSELSLAKDAQMWAPLQSISFNCQTAASHITSQSHPIHFPPQGLSSVVCSLFLLNPMNGSKCLIYTLFPRHGTTWFASQVRFQSLLLFSLSF